MTLFRASWRLAVDGVLLWRATLAGGWRLRFARDGLLRGQGLENRAWFRRDVHPGPDDDAPLIAAWRPSIGAEPARRARFPRRAAAPQP